MEDWFISLIHTHQYLVYGVVIVVSFIEGPILAVLCGILVHLGDLSLIPIYLALMFGDILGDIVWYTLGRLFGHRFISRFGKYFSITEHEVLKVTHIFHKFTNRILIISKLTMGFGFAVVTLFTAGMTKIPFKTYITLNVVGQLFWTAFLLGIGYAFGGIYTQIDSVLGKLSVIVLSILLTLLLIGYGKYIKKKMTA